jgi:diguanylate cyclase (GGDEF)-like protein
VATQWSLPGDLGQAIEHHHNPRPPIEDRRVQRLCAIARCADAVADVFQAKARGRTVLLADEALATLGARRRITLRETANRVLDLMPTEAKDASIVIGEQTGFEDLLTAVARSLVGIAEQYEDVLQRLERTLLEKSELARLLERRNAELQRLAAMDALTGVANRRRFFEAAEEAMRGGGAPISVQMLDLDHFKAINDRLGHAAGDEVLREVAKRLCLAVRPGDLVGRLGGEEFAVLMPGCRPADALRVAERCRTAISSRPVQIPDLGEQVAVTASFGIAGTADATQTLATLLQHADRNQYESKRAGRNRVTG